MTDFEEAVCRILWEVEFQPDVKGLTIDEIQAELAAQGLWDAAPMRRHILRRRVNTMVNEKWVVAPYKNKKKRWYRIAGRGVVELNLA